MSNNRATFHDPEIDSESIEQLDQARIAEQQLITMISALGISGEDPAAAFGGPPSRIDGRLSEVD